jgi:hypothetical protein
VLFHVVESTCNSLPVTAEVASSNLVIEFSEPSYTSVGSTVRGFRMANLSQRAISIVPTFVPTQQTDGHIGVQPATCQNHD